MAVAMNLLLLLALAGPAKLLGPLKLIGLPRCIDARARERDVNGCRRRGRPELDDIGAIVLRAGRDAR